MGQKEEAQERLPENLEEELLTLQAIYDEDFILLSPSDPRVPSGPASWGINLMDPDSGSQIAGQPILQTTNGSSIIGDAGNYLRWARFIGRSISMSSPPEMSQQVELILGLSTDYPLKPPALFFWPAGTFGISFGEQEVLLLLLRRASDHAVDIRRACSSSSSLQATSLPNLQASDPTATPDGFLFDLTNVVIEFLQKTKSARQEPLPALKMTGPSTSSLSAVGLPRSAAQRPGSAPLKEKVIPDFPPLFILRDGPQRLVESVARQLVAEKKVGELLDELEASMQEIVQRNNGAKGEGLECIHVQRILRPRILKEFLHVHQQFMQVESQRKTGNPSSQQKGIHKEALFAPTLAFHCTTDRTVAADISREGLRAAGEITDRGWLLPIVHGSLWGRGLYVARSAGRASMYAVEDAGRYRQMFVGIALLGNGCLVGFENERRVVLDSGSSSSQILWPHRDGIEECHQESGDKKKERKRKEKKEEKEEVTDMPLAFGVDSHISIETEEYVLRDSSQFLPLFIITVGPKAQALSRDEFLQKETAKQIIYDEEEPGEKHEKKQEKLDKGKSKGNNGEEQEEEPFGIFFNRLSGTNNLWTLNVDKRALRTWACSSNYLSGPRCRLQLILLVDRSKSVGRGPFRQLILPACGLLQRRLAPDRTDVIFFGSTVSHTPNVDGAFFQASSQREMPLEGGTNILLAYEKAIDVALSHKERWEREREEKLLRDAQHRRRKEEDKAKKMQGRQGPGGVNDSTEKKKCALERMVETDNMKEEENEKRSRHLREEVRKAKQSEESDLVYCFVLITDGKDTYNAAQQLDQSFSTAAKRISGAGVNCLFKVVGIGKDAHTAVLMKAKRKTETLTEMAAAVEMAPISYCRSVLTLPAVIADLCEDVKSSLEWFSVSISCPDDEDVVWKGFLTSLVAPPSKVGILRLPPAWQEEPQKEEQEDQLKAAKGSSQSSVVTLLFEGTPPRKLILNRCFCVPVLLSSRLSSSASLLRLCHELTLDIKVAAIAGEPVSKAMETLRTVFESVKAANVPQRELRLLDPPARVALMKERRGLVVALEEVINELEANVVLASSQMTSEQQALWLQPAGAMKFGMKILRLKGSVTDASAIGEDLFMKVGKTRVHDKRAEENSALTSTVSGLSGSQHWHQLGQSLARLSPEALRSFSVLDWLYFAGMTGVAVRVFRSESANINPWHIGVSYVSTDMIDTASAMCLLHAGAQYRDSETGDLAPDVIVLENPLERYDKGEEGQDGQSRFPYSSCYSAFRASLLYKSYLAVVCTRNPDLTLPSQEPALLLSAFVRALERLAQESAASGREKDGQEVTQKAEENGYKKRERRQKLIQSIFRILYTIDVAVFCSKSSEARSESPSSHWDSIAAKLLLPNPARYMTEAPGDDVLSVSQVLAVLCLHPTAGRLFNNNQVSEDRDTDGMQEQLAQVAVGLMAESVSRMVRLMLRSRSAKRPAKKVAGETGARAHSQGKETDPREYIRESLGISWASVDVNDGKEGKESEEEGVRDGTFDAAAGMRASSRFFNHKTWTHATPSPQAVVAVFGFARLYHQFRNGYVTKDGRERRWELGAILADQNTADALYSYIETGFEDGAAGRMDSFVSGFLPRCTNTRLLQIGLYVQALRYHTSQTRRAGLSPPLYPDPRPAIEAIAAEERRRIMGDKLAILAQERTAELRLRTRSSRLAAQALLQREFLLFHSGAPQVFTQEEVDRLNRSRPQTDQLELMELSGLLKHHCSFPDCPQYLQNQALQQDLVLDRRQGLYKHLSLFWVPQPQLYWRGLHLSLGAYLRGKEGQLVLQLRVIELQKHGLQREGLHSPRAEEAESGQTGLTDSQRELLRWVESQYVTSVLGQPLISLRPDQLEDLHTLSLHILEQHCEPRLRRWEKR